MKNKKTGLIFFLTLMVSSFFLVCFLSEGVANVVVHLFDEDGVVEGVSAVFYWVGAMASLFALFEEGGGKSKVLPMLFFVFCLVCFGEEISWGQRVFEYNVEWVEERNAQGEFNIHNLNFFQRNRGDDGFVRRFFNAQALFRYVFFGYFLVVPFLFIVSKRLAGFFRGFGIRLEAMRFVWSPLVIIFSTFVLVVLSDNKYLYSILTESREAVYAITIGVHLVLLFGNRLFFRRKRDIDLEVS